MAAKCKRFQIAIAFVAPAILAAQSASGVRLLNSHHVSVDNRRRPHVETHVAVDPRDPNHLIATSMAPGPDGNMMSHAYVSFDGGKRWTRGRLAEDSSVVLEADPMVYIARSGTAFFVALGRVNGVGRSIVRRSTDGGRTWSAGAVLPFADREWMAFDTTNGSFAGRIYFSGTGVTWSRDSAGVREVSAFMARSDDDGRTFPLRSFIARDEGGANRLAPMNAAPLETFVTTRGLFGMLLQQGDDSLNRRFEPESLNVRRLGIAMSNDGGESFGASRYSDTHLVWLRGTMQRRARSSAAFGVPRATVDASLGKYRDRIYIAASSYDKSLDRFVVLVWRTSDLGRSWTTTVASDAPRGDVANPAIAVNREGVIAVTWNDRRDDPKMQCWQLYAAISIDGGDTFRPAKRLSTKQTCVNEEQNWITFGVGLNSAGLSQFQSGATIPARFPNGGDTQGLAADARGVFHAAWINGETGVMQLWHTSFALEPAAIAQLESARSVGSDSLRPPEGMEDVTNDVRFHVVNTKLDFATHTWTITLQLENRSGRSLRGPFVAVMREFLHDIDQGGALANLAVANADSGGKGVGATWRFDVPKEILAPKALSAPRALRFTFEGGVPPVPIGYLTPGFRIFASHSRK